MDFSSFRIWQWMIIGALAGTAVGFAWSNLPNDIDRTGDKQQFIRMVNNANAPVKPPQPLLKNIVVKEPERDPSNVLVYPVTFEYLDRGNARDRLRLALERAGKGDKTPVPPAEAPKYVASGIYAPTPFVGNDSVVDFLKNKKVSFTDRSGAGKYMPLYYGAGGGFVVIGLLWPGMIQLMIKTGLTKAPPPREKKKLAHRTGEDVDEMVAKPAAKAVDGAALGNLNDAMEANLAAGLTSGGPRTATTTAEEPVSTLMSGNAHLNRSNPDAPQAPMTEQEKKDFAGQYYPVARTTKKDGETH